MNYVILLLFTLFPALWASTAAAQRVDVAELQRALANLGYQPGPVNGEWGVETRGALFQFQRENGFGTSLDIGPEQLQLLGMVSASAPEQGRAQVDLEPKSPTPIIGDLGTTMQLYGELASYIVFKAFRERAGMTIITTASNPAQITFVPPDPATGFDNIFVLGEARFETSGIRLAATKLKYKAGAAPDLTQFIAPGSQEEAPDRLCDTVSTDTSGEEQPYICIVSGQISFGGTFKLGEDIVSCREGAMTVSNANRAQLFAPGSACSVNGNPVRLTGTGWTEEPA